MLVVVLVDDGAKLCTETDDTATTVAKTVDKNFMTTWCGDLGSGYLGRERIGSDRVRIRGQLKM